MPPRSPILEYEDYNFEDPDEFSDGGFSQENQDDFGKVYFPEDTAAGTPSVGLGNLPSMNANDYEFQDSDDGVAILESGTVQRYGKSALDAVRGAAQDVLSSGAAQAGLTGLSLVAPEAGIPLRLGAAGLSAWLAEQATGDIVRPEGQKAGVLDYALNIGIPGKRIADTTGLTGLVKGGIKKIGIDTIEPDVFLNKAADLRASAMGATKPMLRGERDAIKGVVEFPLRESLKKIDENGFFQKVKGASPEETYNALATEIRSVSENLDNEVLNAGKRAVQQGVDVRGLFPDQGELRGSVVASLQAPGISILDKDKPTVSKLLDQLLSQYQRVLNSSSAEEVLSGMNQFKRDLYNNTKYEVKSQTEQVENLVLKQVGESVRKNIDNVFSKVAAPEKSNLLSKLNEYDANLFGVEKLLKNNSSNKDPSWLKDLVTGAGKGAAVGSAPGWGLASPDVAFLGATGGGIFNGINALLGNPRVQKSMANIASAVGKTGPTGVPGLGQIAAEQFLAPGLATAGTKYLAEQAGRSLLPEEAAAQLLSPTQAPVDLSQVPASAQQVFAAPLPVQADTFENGLPRETTRWTPIALLKFQQATAGSGAAPLAAELGRALQKAIKMQDKEKSERVIADMAKFFPDVFEPGQGVNGKLFHKEDQDLYMQKLKNAERNRQVTSIFLAKQKNAFLDPMDSRILPIEEGLLQKTEQSLSGLQRKNIRRQPNGPLEYPY